MIKIMSYKKGYKVMFIESAVKKLYRKMVNSKKGGCVKWQNAEEITKAV